MLLPAGRKLRGDLKRVKPERLNFYRLSCAGRDDPFANLGVHPGQLHAALAGGQQTIAVHPNAKASAARVTFKNGEDGILERAFVLRGDDRAVDVARSEQFVNGDDIP